MSTAPFFVGEHTDLGFDGLELFENVRILIRTPALELSKSGSESGLQNQEFLRS